MMQAVPYERLAGESPTSTDLHHAPLEPSHKNPVPKNVAFELLLDENSKVRARIPMRVQIYPHDTTDSIVTTVKNFYGIYDGAASGVSFEDEHGITLIARYENLRNNMTVYVRVIPVQAYTEGYAERFYSHLPVEARKRPSLGEPFQMGSNMAPSQVLENGQSPSRPASRLARKRSMSPTGSRRSASQHKQLSKAPKSRGSSTHGSFHDDGTVGASDSESNYGSGARAKKSHSEQLGSSDISMENILQDGRRKRPKFESSVSLVVHVAIRSHRQVHQANRCCFFSSSGITLVRPSSSSPYHLYLLDFPSTSVCRPRRSRLPIRSSPSAPLHLPTTTAFPTKLWT